MTAERTIRALVVSAHQGVRDEVGKALQRWPGKAQVFWVSQAELASARAEELFPDVVLVDDEPDRTSAVHLIRELGARVPGAAVVTMVEPGAFDRARRAVLAGARGFLTKPPDADELLATVREALAQSRREVRREGAAPDAAGRVIVFCAPKGGTGRTTLAINTAASLQRETRQPVALVDADYAAPAIDVAMNLRSDRNVIDLLPRLSRLDEELVSGVLVPHSSGVQVLLAPPPADLSHPISLPQVQTILVVLRRMFPWVVVDLGLPLDDTAFAFLDGADRIILTVLPEMVGLRNTRLMLDQLYSRGYVDQKVWLVLNRSSLSGGVRRPDIEDRLKMSFVHAVPDDQPLATRSVNRGVPLLVSHGGSAVGRAVRKLARALVRDLAPAEEGGRETRRLWPGLRPARS